MVWAPFAVHIGEQNTQGLKAPFPSELLKIQRNCHKQLQIKWPSSRLIAVDDLEIVSKYYLPQGHITQITNYHGQVAKGCEKCLDAMLNIRNEVLKQKVPL